MNALPSLDENSLWANPSAPPPLRPFRGPLNNNFWALTKQIDELGGEWTYNIFVPRVANFHEPHLAPIFYEPIPNFERLGLEALILQKSAEYCGPADEGVISLAIDVFPSFFSSTDGIVKLPEDEERSIGRHTVNIIGARDAETLYFRHAWSTWAAGNGLGQIGRDYIEAYAHEMWLLRRCDLGPTSSTVGKLLKTSQAEKFASLWRRTVRPAVFRDPVTNLQLRSFECWSLTDEAAAEIIVLHLGRGRRVGVAVMVHYPGDRVSSISDLFVWPPYRHRGLGAVLDRAALFRARQRGSKSVESYVWDADVIVHPSRPEGFLHSQGYEIERFDDRQAAMLGRKAIQPDWISAQS